MSFKFKQCESQQIFAIQSAFRHKFGDKARTLELLFNAGLLEHDAHFVSGLSGDYLALSTEVEEFKVLNKKLLQMAVEHHWLYPKLKQKYPGATDLLTPYSLAWICYACENKPESLEKEILNSLCREITCYWSLRHDRNFISLALIKQIVKVGKSLPGGQKMLKESIEGSRALKEIGIGIDSFLQELGEK